MNHLWDQVLEKLKEKVPSHSYRVWIEPTKVISITDSVIEIGTPNNFYEDWFQEHYLSYIKDILKEMTQRPYQLIFKAGAVPEPVDKIIQQAPGLPQASVVPASVS